MSTYVHSALQVFACSGYDWYHLG